MCLETNLDMIWETLANGGSAPGWRAFRLGREQVLRHDGDKRAWSRRDGGPWHVAPEGLFPD